MKKNKNNLCSYWQTSGRTYGVGHLQRQMIVCYDWYNNFKQIPFGVGVEHSFCFVYALETFVHLLGILLFYAL
jgi:hypothetical protein